MTAGTRPYYVPVGNEEQVFGAAFRQGLSVAAQGPDRLWQDPVRRSDGPRPRPAARSPCRATTTSRPPTSSALPPRRAATPIWVDGPLTRAVREGAICYLDEIVEARQDTTVVLHPLADHRRQLPIDRLGVDARRRAGVLPGRVVQPRVPERAQGPQGLDPPAHGRHRARLPAGRRRGEDRRATRPASTTRPRAQLVQLGQAIRRLETAGLREVASTRVLVAAGRLVAEGLGLRDAARAAVAGPLTDDPAVTRRARSR